MNGEVPLNYMVLGLTVVGNTVGCLERYFEGENINEYGIYLLRLFIEGVWRYVIIDDFIPVVVKDRKASPLFLSTQKKSKNGMEVWPHLLQKALAKVYSTYEALQTGNLEDFLNELSGSVVERLEIRKHMNLDMVLQRQIISRNSLVLVGRQCKSTTAFAEKQYTYLPVLKHRSSPNPTRILDELADEINIITDNSKIPLTVGEIPLSYQSLILC